MGASESSAAGPNFSYDIPDQRGLTNLYNKQVVSVEHMTRPLDSSGGSCGIIPHKGNVVTTADGERYLIHSGPNFGISSQTVVVDAKHMGSSWKPVDSNAGPVRVDPDKKPLTVSDLVKVSGPDYTAGFNDCRHSARRVQDLAKK